MLYWDGDCGFCRHWVDRWRQITGSAVDYRPLQDAPPAVVAAAGGATLERIVLVRADGVLVTGAAAALTSLAGGSVMARWLLGLYHRTRTFRVLSEWGYRWVAEHRGVCAFMTRLLWGNNTLASTYEISGWLFPRLIGLVFLSVFLPLWIQTGGPAGSQDLLREPTRLWFGASGAHLPVWLGLGTLSAIFLMAGRYSAVAAFVAWLCYLTFVTAAPTFLNGPWDGLLLEAGLLVVFFVPWQRALSWGTSNPSRIGRLLVWWLLFRLLFESGVVKLQGDDVWMSGTTSAFHDLTQPLAAWTTGWSALLPEWLHRPSMGAVLVLELLVPFLIVGPRRLRLAAFVGCGLLVVLTTLCGHFGFFSLLTMALAVTLLDDALWPARWRRPARPMVTPGLAENIHRRVLPWVAAILVLLTTLQLLSVLRVLPSW